MVLFNKKSDQNIHQNAPDCIHHFKIFSRSMPPNSLACVQLILFLYEGSHFLFRILSNYIQKFLQEPNTPYTDQNIHQNAPN